MYIFFNYNVEQKHQILIKLRCIIYIGTYYYVMYVFLCVCISLKFLINQISFKQAGKPVTITDFHL